MTIALAAAAVAVVMVAGVDTVEAVDPAAAAANIHGSSGSLHWPDAMLVPHPRPRHPRIMLDLGFPFCNKGYPCRFCSDYNMIIQTSSKIRGLLVTYPATKLNQHV